MVFICPSTVEMGFVNVIKIDKRSWVFVFLVQQLFFISSKAHGRNINHEKFNFDIKIYRPSILLIIHPRWAVSVSYFSLSVLAPHFESLGKLFPGNVVLGRKKRDNKL
jgi:hypothetical protein